MGYTVGVKREYEITGNDLNGDPCLIARSPLSWGFRQHTSLSTKRLAKSSNYLAFPYIVKIGSSLIGIYSDGDSHASSDYQIMVRSDDNGLTWSTATFWNNALNSSVDLSLLTSLLPNNGDAVTLKIWTIKNVSGTLTVFTNSTTSNGGNSYAHWGKTHVSGSSLYRTAYDSDVGGFGEVVLLSSTNKGETWSYVSTIFRASDSRLYSEADIVNTSGTNWLAIVREETGTDNRLYKATSTDNGATWSAASLLTAADISGRQPNLIKMSDGSIILSTGDRVGSSGYNNGPILAGADITGISIWRSTDSGSTWTFRTNIAGIASTDGGQPYTNEIDTNRINIVYYAAQSYFAKPSIESVSLDVDGI